MIHVIWIKTASDALYLEMAGFSYAATEYFAGSSFEKQPHGPRLMPVPSLFVAKY